MSLERRLPARPRRPAAEPGRGPQRHDPGRRRPVPPAGRRRPRPVRRLRGRRHAPGPLRRIADRRGPSVAQADRYPRARGRADATLDALAAEPELRGRLVYEEVLPERAARFAAAAEPLHEEVVARMESRGVDRLFTHQAAAIDRLRAGTSVVVATGHRVGQVALLPAADRRLGRARAPRHRAADLSHQGARAGPAARAAIVARARPARRHLRRRHRRRRPRVGAQERERRAHQSRDAAHGHPPVAQAVGDVPDAPAVRRGRRAAHAARHLR